LNEGFADYFDRDKTEKCIKKMEDSLSFIKSLNDSRIVPSLGPHALYVCSQNLLMETKRIAEENKVKVHIHLAETKNEEKEIYKKYSMTSFEVMQRLRMLGPNYIIAHCVWLSNENIMDMADSGSYVVHNPVSNLKLGSGVAPVNELMHAGAKICLGTDGPASNNSLDMFETMKVASVLHKGVKMNPLATPATKILDAATTNAAGIFGINNRIEVGGIADLIMVNIKKPHLTPMLNPISNIVYSMKSSDVDTVIIDGKIVMKDRKIKGIDEDELYEKVNKSVARLVA
jgi:5-methylthioadenosine/S-adenosylhomocysteine deaminase